MNSVAAITGCHALEILDSRGNPTLKVTVELGDGIAEGVAMVPSGASTGSHEALELRDKENKTRYGGKGVLTAVAHVNERIAGAIRGLDATEQPVVDGRLLQLDGTPDKSHLGANAILGVSLATARAAANVTGLELYQYLGGVSACELPIPLLNVLNGGAHATNGLDIQEFMLVPAGFDTYGDALRAGVEVYHTLKKQLQSENLSTGLGDEGGFAPILESNEMALQKLESAIVAAGYEPGVHFWLALDCAAAEFAVENNAGYKWNTDDISISGSELAQRYGDWIRRYPLISIEDPFGEDDWSAWSAFQGAYGDQCQVVGDDLLVTNPARLAQGLAEESANAILIKLNQIGTLTETMQVIQTAQRAGWGTVISHRSGETSDTFISDLAVAVNAGQIKTGAPARGERVAKYNRLLEIEQRLGDRAVYRGRALYERFLKPARVPVEG